MWEAIVVIAATFGVIAAGIALSWASASPQPSRAVALVDPDACALARHEQARMEIQTIERVTRQLMRAAATAELSGNSVVPAPPSASRVTNATGGFAWRPSDLAGTSTSDAQVIFYVPLRSDA